MSRSYALIAPSRDEGRTLAVTLASIAAQTVPPTVLVVVDDGSTDDTAAILRSHAARMPYLRVVTREDRGARRLGGGVVDAFDAGLATVDLAGIDYVCKVDTDLDLPPAYFETLMAKMEADPALATVSGKAWFRDPRTGALVPELSADSYSVGMTKFYRTAALAAIGGFPRSIGWDGIDCHLCRLHGMKANSVRDPALRFVHLRPMGSSHISLWEGRKRHGLGAWVMGVPPVFMLATALYRLGKRPYLIGAAGVLWGYLRAWTSGVPRFDVPGYRASVRRYHRLALLIGRSRAAECVRLDGVRQQAG